MPDFLWECVSCSGTRKRKSKLSCANGTATKAKDNQNKKKKKKSCKCKDATTTERSKKKDKKKKKKKKEKVGEQLECAVVTQVSVPAEGPVVRTEPPDADRNKDLLDPVAQAGNSKLKKRVVFDLSPCAVRIKRPKLSSSTPPCVTKSILLKSEGEGGPKEDNDSQDVNSQDLFITQKTFRAPSPEASSGEATDKASFAILSPLTKPGVSLSPRGRRERPHFYRRASKPNMEAEAEPFKALRKEKNGETMTQTSRMGLILPKEAESSSPVCKISSHKSPEVELSVVPPSLEAAKSKKQFYVVSRKSLTSTSTQTENFFTTELSSYHLFCRRRSAGAELLRPLDLTLPHRARAAACMSIDTHGEREEAGLKNEMTPSLQSDSEPKSAETVTSGEENEPLARAGGKMELAQVTQCPLQASCLRFPILFSSFQNTY